MELNNIRSLDGIRAIAIFLVLIWHYLYCQIIDTSFVLGANAAHEIQYWTFWTWSGVDLFFVLSGFLIGRILIYNRDSKNYFRTFYTRRILRIFPAYYLIVLVFIALVLTGIASKLPWLTEKPFPFYSYLLLIQNFWIDTEFGAHWLGVTWSLAIEEQFYLILPFLIFVINPKHLPKFLIVLIILAPICRANISGLGSYALLPARMDSLLVGVLIAHYYLSGKITDLFKGKKNYLFALLAVLFALLFFVGNGKDAETIGGVFIHSILTLLYGTLVVLALISNEKSVFYKALSNSFMSFFARISFMIYLTHQIFSGLLHQLILGQRPNLGGFKDIMVTLFAFIVTVLFSLLSYYLFERPILNIGKKYKY